MKIEEIEKLIQKESRWKLKDEKSSNKLNNLLVKVLSFFSIIFSLSIIRELSSLGIELYLVIIFGIFATLLITVNEIIKVSKLISVFSFNKSTENIILSILTVLLSIIVSTYGIYKFLDRSDKNTVKTQKEISIVINDTTEYYNNKINEVISFEVSDIEPFKSEYIIYNNQLEQYLSDRDNYKNSNLTYNSNLRDFYKDINLKIDKANEGIITINNKFSEYKKNEINVLTANLNSLISEIKLNKDINQSNFENKNNIIIVLFIFFTLLTELGIVYISIKIANVNVENKTVKEHNNNILKDKISFIRNTKEFKQFELYKNTIERLLSTKTKGSSVTVNEIKLLINGYNLSTNQFNQLIDELKTIGIISPSVRRIGSKVELDLDQSIAVLRRYFEPNFKNY